MGNPERQNSFYEVESPQASRELSELRTAPDYHPPFDVIRRRVIDDFFEGRMTIDATVVIRIGSVEETEAARGVGVVNALDNALRKALVKYFPCIEDVQVVETYTHGSGDSTQAEIVSVKKFSDGQQSWTTLSKSANTVEAGWESLVDGYEWRIIMEKLRASRAASSPKLSRR